MYLKDILLENVASIDFLDVTLPFNDDGTPQPIIIVGVKRELIFIKSNF